MLNTNKIIYTIRDCTAINNKIMLIKYFNKIILWKCDFINNIT